MLVFAERVVAIGPWPSRRTQPTAGPTDFCDQRKLTLRQRLELFVPVCNAVQHAHQKGIIHHDIKSSNVLVAVHDDKPVPKVIDFGVAKATGTPLTDKTLNTGFE